ncbi:MAG: hypothetical protein Q8Q81_07415 [Oxalobacteraceae bacterium]|nr:hypothetical protein [Oxalobacteraceae bacterium]
MHVDSRLTILLLAVLTIGCTMPLQSNPDPLTSSTQGSTLVRMATITAVGSVLISDIADGESAEAGDVIAGNAGAPPSGQSAPARTVTELLLRFEDGDGASVAYRIEPGVVFQPGERVKVITRSGHTRITH